MCIFSFLYVDFLNMLFGFLNIAMDAIAHL
jgi:hypothetical protein